MICTWAHVDEPLRKQYSTYICETAARLCTRAWHFEVGANPSLRFENSPQANVFTIFEAPKLDPTNEPTDLLLDVARRAPEHVRIDARHYEELPESFQQDYWTGSYNDLNFLIVGTLYLRDAPIFEEYFDWTRAEVVPNLLITDEFLRGRYFKTTRTLLTENTRPIEHVECANILALFELNSEDFLWDKFVDIATSRRWLKMEPHLEFEMTKWFLSHCFGSNGQLVHAKTTTDDNE